MTGIRKSHIAVIILLLSVFCLQSIWSMRVKSPIFDEMNHIAAGYSYVVTGDYRMNYLHPPLTKVFSGMPLLFFDLPHPSRFPAWDSTDDFSFGKQFIDALGPERDRIITVSRLSTVLLSLLLGLCVFQWARELWGVPQGIFALFLYVFEPNIIAHSRFVTPEIGVTTFTFLCVYLLWKYAQSASGKYLVMTGASLGLALLSKLSALILIPLVFFLFSFFRPVKRTRNVFAAILAIFVIALLVLWLGYGFETGTILTPKDAHPTFEKVFNKYPGGLRQEICRYAERLKVPFPSFFRGFGELLYYVKLKRHSFYHNEHFMGGSFKRSLLAFLIKTPIPFTLLFIFVILLRRGTLIRRDQLFLLLPPAAFFAATPFHIGLHLKQLLPAYPFLILFICQVFDRQILRGLTRRFFVGVMIVWIIIGTLRIFPHYLAYFNESIGGPQNGYNFLVDSNLDWGQDLILLKKYLAEKNVEEISLAYFGTADPEYYGIRYAPLVPFRLTEGWIAVSATHLQGVHAPRSGYAWLKKFVPEAKIGYSIFVYNITKIKRLY